MEIFLYVMLGIMCLCVFIGFIGLTIASIQDMKENNKRKKHIEEMEKKYKREETLNNLKEKL